MGWSSSRTFPDSGWDSIRWRKWIAAQLCSLTSRDYPDLRWEVDHECSVLKIADIAEAVTPYPVSAFPGTEAANTCAVDAAQRVCRPCAGDHRPALEVECRPRRDRPGYTMQLKRLMRRNVTVVAPDTSLHEAARRMGAHNVSVLPVCDGAKIVGLLTVRDITVRATAQGCDPRRSRVRDVMMAPAIYGKEEQEDDEAARLMQRWRLHMLPVVNHSLRLVGMISLSDLLGNTSRGHQHPGRAGHGVSGRQRSSGVPPATNRRAVKEGRSCYTGH
jgi:CBS domain-containing protein